MCRGMRWRRLCRWYARGSWVEGGLRHTRRQRAVEWAKRSVPTCRESDSALWAAIRESAWARLNGLCPRLAKYHQNGKLMNKIFIVFLALALPGCAATPINPGAESVRLTNNEPGKDCKFLGDVIGNQGNIFTGPWTSNANLEAGARNDIKNRAAAMGGNLVTILTQRAGQTGSYGQQGGSSQQTNVVMTGNVYRCPE